MHVAATDTSIHPQIHYLLNMNKEVQNYLLSLEKYDKATEEVNALTKRIIGINPSEILGTVDKNIQNSISNYFN